MAIVPSSWNDDGKYPMPEMDDRVYCSECVYEYSCDMVRFDGHSIECDLYRAID